MAEEEKDKEKELEELLVEFKSRMKIFNSIEDDTLKRSLSASKMAIKRMTGSDDLGNEEVKELVIERARYAYNDSLEFFEDNFQSMILGVSLEVPYDQESEI